jgi:hypothetical protein
LTAFKDIPALKEVREDQKFHEKHQEYLEEAKQPWKSFDEEKIEEHETEGFLPCMSSDPLCIQDTNQQLSEDMHGMTREDIQTMLINKRTKGTVTTLKYGSRHPSVLSIPSSFNTSWHHINQRLVPHILIVIEVYFSYLDMSLFEIICAHGFIGEYSYT